MDECLNCGYVRQPEDEYILLSPVECPECGVEYGVKPLKKITPIYYKGKKCLNCGYERTFEDDQIVYSTECPKCLAIYERVERIHFEKEKEREKIERERFNVDRKFSEVYKTNKEPQKIIYERINSGLTYKTRFSEVIRSWSVGLGVVLIIMLMRTIFMGDSRIPVVGRIFIGILGAAFFVLIPPMIWAGITYIITSNYGWIRNSPKIKTLLRYDQIKQLEKIRSEFSIPSDIFTMAVYSSSALGRIIIERDYTILKKVFPKKDEQTILRELLSNDFKNAPVFINNEELIITTVDTAMKKINTLSELCIYIEALERERQPDYYESIIGRKIEAIIGIGR